MSKREVEVAQIKAVVFDVGGVLQLGGLQRKNPKMVHTSGVHQIMADRLKITMDQYFDSIDTAYAKSIEGQLSKSVLMGILSCNLNFPKDKLEKLFMDTYKKIYKKNKWLFNAAKQMKKQGLKLGILSDQWHLSKEALIPKKDFSFFDKKVISCDVRARKPSLEVYKKIINELKVKPNEILFIDNQEWNIIPAHKLGMNTILFTDNKKTKEQLEHFGIYVK